MAPPTSSSYVCLNCGYDLTGIPDDPGEGGGWKCPECGKLNLPGDYYLALQHMMGPKAWIATVFLLTLLNIVLCLAILVTGRIAGIAFTLGFFACIIESAVVCSIAGRRANAQVRVGKMMLLAGALCCFTLVGTLLAVGLILTFAVGHF